MSPNLPLEDAIKEVASKINVEGATVADVVSLLRNLSRKIAIGSGDHNINHITSKVQKSEDLRKNINIIVNAADKYLE